MKRTRILAGSAWIAVALTVAAGVAAREPRPFAPAADEVAARLAVASVDVAELDVPLPEPDGRIRVDVPLSGERVSLELTRHSLRSDGFQVLVPDLSGELVRHEVAPPRTWAGTALDRPGSVARLSISPSGTLTGFVRIDDVEWIVQPLVELFSASSPALHAIYRTGDVLEHDGTCGNDDIAPEDRLHTPPSSDARASGLPPVVCEIAFDADVEFYQRNGSNVDSTVDDIEAIMNAVELIYERDTNVTYEITTVIVRTGEPDPYSTNSPSGLLSQFQITWNTQLESIRRDIAHLMTGRNLQGSVIGIAQLGVVCSENAGYGLSESRFSSNFNSRVGLTAHELGHNWNSPHCNDSPPCWIMCSGLGGCGGDVTKFGPFASGIISTYRNVGECLDEEVPPIDPPFADAFDAGGAIPDPTKWTYNLRAGIAGQANNEPTPPLSLGLDAFGPDEYDDDEIRSNFIRLGGASRANLSFWLERLGPDPGETLTVDYFGSDGDWHEIVEFEGTGAEESWFRFSIFELPALARHDEFRVRFRADVDDTLDRWFIDNVTVAVPDLSVLVSSAQSTVAAGGTLLFDASVTNDTGGTLLSTAWVDVFRPDGSPLSSANPRFGPKTFNLGGGATRERTGLPLRIPAGAPPGTGYVIRAYVGTFPNEVHAASEIQFEVTP